MSRSRGTADRLVGAFTGDPDAAPTASAAPSGRCGRRPGVVWRYTGDGMLLLAVDSGDPVHLDAAGAVVWEELREPATVDQLVSRVAARVGACSEVVDAGVREVLRRLTERRLALGDHG